MILKNVEGGRAIRMAAGTILLILMLAGGVGFRISEIALGDMIFDYGDRRQDWW